MRWVRSTTSKAWVAGGKTIPAFSSTDPQFLQLNDSDWEQIAAIPVVAALLKHGDLVVQTEAPAQLANNIPAAMTEIAQLRSKNTELQEQLHAVKEQLKSSNPEEYNKLKQEAIEELKAMQAKLDAANAEIAALKGAAEEAPAPKSRSK